MLIRPMILKIFTYVKYVKYAVFMRISCDPV
ncbi:hypothetical protein JOF46_003999 [Paeniglutamicibacter psychrophenolicus]|uniref:Uncharacterized protein n=1 Tax=Paeniglutamicibacter psychrophenolicus TaxID=257454 RepID=A0ABS4WIP6_9MICC|nr:hypothetical protein [Paeniglutamicibacter psychrophenolicus]